MDPWDDATTLAALVENGESSPTELVDAAIDRIEKLNPELNAVIWTRFDEARKEAAGQLPNGPFRGVPLLLKDLHNLAAGQPRCEGMRALRGENVLADHDNAVTRRFRQAGFIILGRTNLPELGTVITTEPLAFGPTRNPWNTEHSTGGSSGGSAAAVASGMVSVAHGSDAGGSIRIPASECGLVGLKPCRGRVSAAPDFGEVWSGVSTNGALARTMRDAARLLDVLAGPEPGDPYAAPTLARPLADEVGAPVGRLRIGVLDHPPLDGVNPSREVQQAIRETASVLSDLGHDVRDGHPAAMAETEFGDRYVATIAANVAFDVKKWSSVIGRQIADDELEDFNASMVAQGRAISGIEHIDNVEWLHRWSRRMLTWWADGWDLLVCPVINGTPPPIGYLTDPKKGSDRMFELMQYSTQFNATGQPALSLPLHVSTDGLPIGVQFVAAAGREDLLVRLGAQLEQATPWTDRRPAVSA